MKKVKRMGNIIWGITYIIGGLVGTILLMPFIIGIVLMNLIKK
jgi:hypothetical protein